MDRNQETLSLDFITPAMTTAAPGPGKRVRQVAPEYTETDVHHALYLPVDWKSEGGTLSLWSTQATNGVAGLNTLPAQLAGAQPEGP